MSTLRSARLILSLAMCNLTLLNCAMEQLKPELPSSALVSESAAGWTTPEAPAEPGREDDSEDAVLAHLANLRAAQKWSYEGERGPASWGDLSSNNQACKVGTSQSPIDIVTKNVQLDRKLELIDFGYAAMPLQIFNNGHTIEITNRTPAAINAAKDTWKLKSWTFHSPSEHSIDGKLSAMEMQLAHMNADGDVAVVAMLFNAGDENKALAPVFERMPADVTDGASAPADASIDLAGILPPAPSYFTYTGSLTVPQCTEGVRWFVLEPIGEVSEAQIQKLHAVTHGTTNRPVQPIGERTVLRPY